MRGDPPRGLLDGFSLSPPATTNRSKGEKERDSFSHPFASNLHVEGKRGYEECVYSQGGDFLRLSLRNRRCFFLFFFCTEGLVGGKKGNRMGYCLILGCGKTWRDLFRGLEVIVGGEWWRGIRDILLLLDVMGVVNEHYLCNKCDK